MDYLMPKDELSREELVHCLCFCHVLFVCSSINCLKLAQFSLLTNLTWLLIKDSFRLLAQLCMIRECKSCERCVKQKTTLEVYQNNTAKEDKYH